MCVLQEVRDKYTAVVKMIDSGDKLKLDQNHVETVIPAPGERKHATLRYTLLLVFIKVSSRSTLLTSSQASGY